MCVNLIQIEFIMPEKASLREQIRAKIGIQTSASITDYQYNHNGTQLAVSDSDGFVYIYRRNGEAFNKISQFRGDDAAIWKISWADPSFGDVIGIGSFKRKVAVYQFKNNDYNQIAFHELHEGSVNHVEWASSAYGLKLYSAGSDGSVAILELKKNSWNQSSYGAHECSINSLSLRPIALNQQQDERINSYPMMATVAKDNVVKIWRHVSQFAIEQVLNQSRLYQQVAQYKPHKEAIRSLLWKKRWVEANPIEYELFTASEDGTVKLASFVNHKIVGTVSICQYEFPIFKISQSLTGNMLSVSVANESETSYLFAEKNDWHVWECVQELK